MGPKITTVATWVHVTCFANGKMRTVSKFPEVVFANRSFNHAPFQTLHVATWVHGCLSLRNDGHQGTDQQEGVCVGAVHQPNVLGPIDSPVPASHLPTDGSGLTTPNADAHPQTTHTARQERCGRSGPITECPLKVIRAVQFGSNQGSLGSEIPDGSHPVRWDSQRGSGEGQSPCQGEDQHVGVPHAERPPRRSGQTLEGL